jgi:hypothetical protein
MREKHTIFPGNVAEHNAHALAPKAGDFAATLDRVQARTRATPCRVDEEEQVARASSPPAAGLLRRALSGDYRKTRTFLPTFRSSSPLSSV